MINAVELGRRMMVNAATLDDDNEFNQWARLGSKLIGMGSISNPKSFGDLSPEEQQVLARAIFSMKQRESNVA